MRVVVAFLMLALAQTPAYRAEIEQYRKERIEKELTAPDGWLAVRGLFWLHEGANTAGSDPSSDIKLPPRAPKKLGVYTVTSGQVTFAADPSATVTKGQGSTIVFNDITITPIRRGDKVGLRMWDPESPNRTRFKGLQYFPLNSAYRLKARFTPYATLKKVPVPNVLGQIVPMDSPGYVEFALEGKTYRLEPVYETSKHEDLFFMFKDATSRSETYEAGRFLHTPLPKDGVVDLDFNRAYNPPCAFTEFATCPLPVKENQLDVRIPAGELRFHLGTSQR